MGFTADGHRVLRKYRRSMKQRTVDLATVQAMAQSNPVRLAKGLKTHIAAQASAGKCSHGSAPSRSWCHAPRAYNSRRCNAGDVSDEKLDVATLQRAFAGQS
jgi:hypothetical protein